MPEVSLAEVLPEVLRVSSAEGASRNDCSDGTRGAKKWLTIVLEAVLKVIST